MCPTCNLTPSSWCKTDVDSTDLVQIFYDLVDYATQMAIDYAAGGRLRKLRAEVAWDTIEDLAQYEDEEWDDPIFLKKEVTTT
ncbi:hypothetical protein Tco_0774995 [Tanacetum coccineum]